MTYEDRNRLADRSKMGPCAIRIASVEIADALQIAECRGRDDYLGHFLGFGLRVAALSMRAVKYSNTSFAS